MNKTYIRTFFLLLALMLSATGTAWADDKSKTQNGFTVMIEKSPNDAAGNVTIESITTAGLVTLKITPAAGYSINTSMITAEPMVALSRPARGNTMLADAITVSGPNSDVTSPTTGDLASGTYTFTIPSDYTGAYVTVRFFKKTSGVTQIYSLDELKTAINATDNTTHGGNYELMTDIVAPSDFTSIAEFTGTFDGGLHTISNLGAPLFKTINGAIVRNVILDKVYITEGYTNPNNSNDANIGNTGAIACVANGATRIYNCGILNGEVGGNKYVGGLVGLLNHVTGNAPQDGARVINCYSYATITNGTDVGGIVGHNNYKSKASDIRTMVMNCMFYGDITGGTTISPVYGGEIINNLNSGGINNFNYYAYDELKTKAVSDGKYNCALAVEEKYLNRIEFYRLLLNSNKKLAAKYASTSTSTVNPSDMAKWVLEMADKSIDAPYPYPILKAQGRYPSIINYDVDNARQLILEKDGRISEQDRNKGGKIGTLSVTITAPGQWTNKPTDAKLLDKNGNEITTSRDDITLIRTDKDFDRFNFNYDKVQLPYYNDYGTKNYTGYKVVTGWKIIDITTVTGDTYTSSNYDYSKSYSGDDSDPEYFDFPNYNFADRKSSQKDLYSVSGRIFSQGAYFDVPYDVTSITIEPYWGNAAYVSDEYLDVVCKMQQTTRTGKNRNDFVPQDVTQLGQHFSFSEGKATSAFNSQDVYTSISAALGDSHLTGTSVYDNAVVLVSNLHQRGVPSTGDKAFTMMSVDLDKDNEPDYSLIYFDNERYTVSPLRFDFLNIPGTAQAQKPSNTSVLLNAAIFRTLGWFEITNTALIYFSQFEYENQGTGNDYSIHKANAPLIILGGYIDQFVSAQSCFIDGKTIYIHVGGNVLINSFGLGTHGDGSKGTPHVPVSVTGGDFNNFYLTGTYRQDATIIDDNAECYISGGRFGELAGACQEQIGSTNSEDNGNIQWQIYDADITDFYGGGINDAKPVQGNVTTEIFNSHVNNFYGGPKFGNMASGKKVTTTAEKCTFDNFFGAGYGGNSYSRVKYFDGTDYNFDNQQKYYYAPGSTTNHQNEKGKYYNGTSTGAPYGKKGPGVATDFDYEFFVWTSGATGARFFIKFVSFSLAQCNDVESTLKKCIINENFYGGGRLGKVSGTTTSILENCTVIGNVFGAGYSATVPKIKVRSGGFTTKPSFNGSAGMFVPGVPAIPTANDLSGTTDYEWIHKDSYPNNATVGFVKDDDTYGIDGTKVVTTQDLSSTNLGAVENAILTLQGSTTVGGNVFGGGESSAVSGSTTVTLKGNSQVNGNVFGGGDEGKVFGNTTVNIE